MASIRSFVVLGSLQASFHSWHFHDNNPNYPRTQTIIFQFDSDSKMLMILARISFCTYLCHLMVVYQWVYVKNYDFYFDVGGVFVVYVGVLILCLVFGYLMTVLIEVPCANCIRLLTRREVKK